MRLFYSFLMNLLTPYLFLRLVWKGRKLPAYKERIFERFCIGTTAGQAVDFWVHAVSLGEVIAATPLIDSILKKNGSVLITTMTPTGSAQVKTRFGNKVSHRYIPYDLSWALKRFFKEVKPGVAIIMETELWPNLIYQARKAKVPLILANARLSDRSLNNYLKLKFLFKSILNQFSAIFPQSEEDAIRFITLGARKELVQVLGNMKFDLQTHVINNIQFNELKNLWNSDRPVVIAASTHDNEESQILAHLKRLQQAIPNIILLIAPRHPERFQTVYQLCVQAGFKTGLRSQMDTITKDKEVIVLDSLGELMSIYQISDYAFVGGSLVPVGGHNVLEPIAMNIPVLSGDQVHNFKTICSDLQEAKAIQLVHHAEELIDAIIRLHENKEFKNQMVENAKKFLDSNKGSVAKHLSAIQKIADIGLS